MAYYPFQMSGQGPTFAKPYTKEGKQYFGFYTQPDGRVAFLRKVASDPDSKDTKTVADYLDPNTKFYPQDPNVALDPQSNFKTIRDFAEDRDGYLPDGSLIGYRGGQHRIYPAMTYQGLKEFLDKGNPKPVKPVEKQTYRVNEKESNPMNISSPGFDPKYEGTDQQSSGQQNRIPTFDYLYGQTPPPAFLGGDPEPFYRPKPGETLYRTDQAAMAENPNYPGLLARSAVEPRQGGQYAMTNTGERVTVPIGFFGTPEGENRFSATIDQRTAPYTPETPPPQETVSPQTPTPQESRQMVETPPTDPPVTGEKLIERLGEQAQGTQQTIPQAGQITTAPQTIAQNELLTAPTGLQTVGMPTALASKDNLAVPTSTKTVANTYGANLVGNTPLAIAAEGKLASESLIGDVQGAVSAEAQVMGQTEDLDPKASVQYQLAQLYESLEEGKPLPAWAAPAVRAVSGIMQQRGLGSSSMASAAITQAIFEAGIPIAKADADRFAAIQLQNLNNKQQATLQNAMTFAAMDKANLDARMTAAVNNSKSFLSIDMANLDNKQKTQSIDYQGKLQALLTDAASQNASGQFNAKSQNQLDEFFAELDGQIQQSNANRLAATEQFNVDQVNANARYVQGLNDQREQFNLNMQTQIDQSNAVWRRNINTANTAAQNETNRQNALNTLNVSQSALNALWQRYRDEASWLFTSSESAKQREHQLALTAMEVSAQTDMYDMKSENDMYGALGGATLAGIFGLLG
jgi:hypothetical protein